MPENYEAWELWCAVHTQWIAAAFSLIGLNRIALYQEAERMGIDISNGLMMKIRMLERKTLERANAQPEGK